MTNSATVQERPDDRDVLGRANAWDLSTTFPSICSAESYGIFRRKRLTIVAPEQLSRLISSSKAGPSSLMWTPVAPRLLTPWEHPELVIDSWRGARRFWLSLWLLQLTTVGMFVLQGVTTDARLLPALQLLSFQCLLSWPLFLTARKVPGYAATAIIWRRFNAWVQLRGSGWTGALVALIVAMLALQSYLQSLDALRTDVAAERFGVGLQTLFADGEWWRLVTSSVLHTGVGHAVGNLVLLWFMGRWMQAITPHGLVPLVILISGTIGSFIGFADFSPKLAVGMSAGIFGIMGFLVATSLRTRQLPPFMGPFVAVLGLLSFLSSGDSVRHAAHLGGFLVGFLLAVLLVPRRSVLPVKTSRTVNAIGHFCGVVVIATAVSMAVTLLGS